MEENILENLLKQNKDYITQDGSLNKSKIIQEAQNYSNELIEYLYSNQKTKEWFFKETKTALVFKQAEFINYFYNLHSIKGVGYTTFKNKIGLGSVNNNNYIKASNDVVLNFPFKDCVLQGGQSTEEKGKQEMFYHTVLAKPEIDRLLDNKVLTNGIKVTTQGEQNNVSSFTKDSNGNIKDNLLIKGNNLLALHSLKYKFEGRVKLIYIDPPYNTGNDGFKYNDNFNHSTWLVFMKNRLEIAKYLLSNNGVIFVQCDDNEQAYLKVLMDEVFGRENFVSIMPRKTTGHMRVLASYELQKLHDYICVFAKNRTAVNFNKRIVGEMKFEHTDSFGRYTLKSFQNSGQDGTRKARPKLYYPIYINLQTKEISLEKKEDCIEILPKRVMNDDGRWLWSKEKVGADKNLLEYKNGTIFRKHYYNPTEDQNKYQAEKTWLDNFLNSKGTIALNNILDEKGLFSNPKPEELLELIIEISTQQGDIVLDFFAGSGTTGAVAHKMNRQWILIEQMDYIESITKERIKKVVGTTIGSDLSGDKLEYDTGGISKKVNWQGGGSFIYMELKALNQIFIQQIANAQTTTELQNIKQNILEKGFIDYRLNTDALNLQAQDFTNLTIDEQKQILIDILDKNQLYVNYTEIEDTMFNCTKQDIELSNNFYKK